MQLIKHEKDNLYQLFTEFDNVYTHTSSRKKHYLVEPVFDPVFQDLFNMFKSYGYSFNITYKDKELKVPKVSKTKGKNIIVCFSGGKDSIATVKYYQQRGYNVYLYHMKGINYTYKDEYLMAEKASAFLQVPLYIDTVNLKGNHDYIEHPMKNMIIANGALQYGIRENIGTEIAFGNYTTSTLRDDNFEICGGDDCEMWELYENIISKYIPNFKIHRVLENLNDTLKTFVENPELIPYAQSCIGPYRYKQYLRKNNQEKYHIQLPESHCGSCWKCCLEYCVFTDKGILEYNPEYYKHCMVILQKTLRMETKQKCNFEDVWNHYFFYDKCESNFWL